MNDMQKKNISLVIPCYRSEHTVRPVIDEIVAVAGGSERYDYEIIAVNDCSPDGVYSVIRRAADENPRITCVDLAKNMGRIAALMAGFSLVTGDFVVVLDDDGQCPMDHLFELVEPLNGDYDVSIAKYPVKKQSAFKNFGSRVNERMTRLMIDKPKSLYLANFMAMRRYVVEEIKKYENPYPYLAGLVLRTTSRIVNVPMEERERMSGTTTYTFKKLVGHWMNGLTAFSVKPLRIATVTGACVAVAGFVMGLVYVIRKIMNPADILAGYTSLMAVMLFIGGVMMLMMGMMGEYIGRSYISINKSPQYVIRDVHRGGDAAEAKEQADA